MANATDSSGGTTILLVEDEVMVRVLLSGGLREAGHTVIEAANADEAAAILGSHLRVDLVITDMRMPGSMDGAALVRLIRTDYPFVKVIMVAAQPPDAVTRTQLHGYLQKPVTPTQLNLYVQTFMPCDGGVGNCG